MSAHSARDPFRTGAYADIKGPLFNHSYRYSTGSPCCLCICACVSMRVCVCVFNAWCELSQTLSRDRHMGLFMCEQQRFDRQSSGKQNNCAFHAVCLWRWGRQEMRSCWGPWLCVHGAYHKAGPDWELNMNRLLAGPTELMEMRNSSFSVSWNVWRRQAMSFHPRCSSPWF